MTSSQKVFHILVVEDSPADFVLLRDLLSCDIDGSFKLTHVMTLGEAASSVRDSGYDLVLLDMELPDSIGLQTFTRLYAKVPHIPIIILTGLADEALGLDAVRAGAQDYLTKGSIEAETLRRKITYAIERKHLEAEIVEGSHRYERLLASVTNYIYTVTIKNGHAVSTSHGPACVTVTGYAAEEYAADPLLWYNMVHEADRAEVSQQAKDIQAGVARPLEHRIKHKDGTMRWVRNTPVVTKDESGRVIECDGLITDITERRAAEDALHGALTDLKRSHEELKASQMLLINAEKMESIGRLAAGVAHEVKNPLAILLMNMDFLARSIERPGKPVAEALQDMRDAIFRADAIVRGLLDFSASDRLELRPESINAVIAQATLLVKHDLKKNRILFRKSLDPNLPAVSIDRQKAGQVFVNLFTNAIDAMPDGGTLLVRTYAEPPREKGAPASVAVEVEDTGVGIPPEKLSKIFDPFYTTKQPGKGTGLGLTVSRKIIDMHGGSMAIANRQDGGARFTLRFPALRQ